MAESVLKIVVTAVDNFTARFSKMASRAAEIGKRFEKVGKKVTRAVTLPIVALGAASVKAAADFEKGMSNVATLVDTNVESMERMGEEVLKISENVPVALDDLTSALFDLRSAGTDAGDAMARLENSGKLAVSALGSTKQAADVATSAINAFGLEGEQADAVFGQFFLATKFGKTTLADMSRGFGGVAGTVAENNIQLEEFLAATAALTTTGLKASEAYTQQRAVLAGLTRQTEDTRKVFKALGVKDFPELVTQAGGYQDALEQVVSGLNVVGSSSKQVRAALKRLDVKNFKQLEKQAGSTAAAYEMLSAELGTNSKALLKALGSTEALNAVIALTGEQGDTAREALASMGDASAELDEAFRKQSQTQAAQWQRTKNIMRAAGIQIGKVLAPVVAKLAKMIQGLAKWFGGLDSGTKEWILTIAGIAAVVGPVILILGKLAAAIGIIGTVVAVVATELKLLGAAFAANPIGFAIAGIALAAAIIIEHWEPISAFFRELWAAVVQVFREAQREIEKVLDFLNEKIDALANELNTLIEDVTGVDVKGRFTRAFTATEALVGDEGETTPGGVPGLGLATTLATQQLQSTVRVEFNNVPPGTRVRSEGEGVDLSVGVQLEGMQ